MSKIKTRIPESTIDKCVARFPHLRPLVSQPKQFAGNANRLITPALTATEIHGIACVAAGRGWPSEIATSKNMRSTIKSETRVEKIADKSFRFVDCKIDGHEVSLMRHADKGGDINLTVDHSTLREVLDIGDWPQSLKVVVCGVTEIFERRESEPDGIGDLGAYVYRSPGVAITIYNT